VLDKKTMESLIRCGAFDSLGHKRSALMEALEEILSYGNILQRDKTHGQLSIFGRTPLKQKTKLPQLEEWDKERLVRDEKELLGIYFTESPFSRYEGLSKTFAPISCEMIKEMEEGAFLLCMGVVSSFKEHLIKTGPQKGGRYLTFKFQDRTGVIEAIIFESDLEKNRPYLLENSVCFLLGRVDRRRDEPTLRVKELIPADLAIENLAGGVKIALEGEDLLDDRLHLLQKLILENPGAQPVFFELTLAAQEHPALSVRIKSGHHVKISKEFYHKLIELLPPQQIRFLSRESARTLSS
jgi:DNA polymerase-3 subunit alpha